MTSTMYITQGIKLLQYIIAIGQITYVIYAFILMRQTKVLTKSLITPAKNMLNGFAIVHFIVSVILTAFTLLTLK